MIVFFSFATGVMAVFKGPGGFQVEALYVKGGEEKRETYVKRGILGVMLTVLRLFFGSLVHGLGSPPRGPTRVPFMSLLPFLAPILGIAAGAVVGLYLRSEGAPLAPFEAWRQSSPFALFLDSLIFLAFFVLLFRVSRAAAYHAAEHKGVYLLRKGLPLTLEAARRAPVLTPNCGSNVVFLALLLTSLLYALIRPFYPLSPDLGLLLVLPAFFLAPFLRSTPLVYLGYPFQRLLLAKPKDEELERALQLVREVGERKEEVLA